MTRVSFLIWLGFDFTALPRGLRSFGFAGSAMLLFGSCGGNSPAAPSAAAPIPTPTPAPAVLTISGGDTGLPVPGAQVIVAGVPRVTDSAGQVRLENPVAGVTVDIIAAGYFDRQTLVREGASSPRQLTLWPREPPLHLFDEAYTRTLVYTSSSFGSEGAGTSLARLGTGTTQVRIVLTSELFADSDSRFFHQFAADAMNTAVGGLFRYSVGSEGVAGSLNVSVAVNPGGVNCTGSIAAFASVGTNGAGAITSASITYCDIRFARSGRFILHEMGHTMGLRHSGIRSDVMNAFPAVDVFTDRELLIMKLMYQRPPGNVFPDNDRATAGLASNRLETMVCGG